MISRQWRGLAKAAHADAYGEHLRTETFPTIAKIPGFAGASIMRRTLSQGVEFLVVTQWASLTAIQAFTGEDAERAVVPSKVQGMMLEYDRIVRHYEVVV